MRSAHNCKKERSRVTSRIFMRFTEDFKFTGGKRNRKKFSAKIPCPENMNFLATNNRREQRTET